MFPMENNSEKFQPSPMGFTGKVETFLLSLFSRRVKCWHTMQLNSTQLKQSFPYIISTPGGPISSDIAETRSLAELKTQQLKFIYSYRIR